MDTRKFDKMVTRFTSSLTLIFFLYPTLTYCQRPEWVLTIDNDNAYTMDCDYMVADKTGNVYLTGHFSDTSDFDPGPGTFYLWPVQGFLNPSNYYLASYSAEGNFRWAFRLGPGQDTKLGGMSLDPDGKIVLTGFLTSPSDFDPGPAVHNIGVSSGGSSFFVAKYDTGGKYIWAFAVSSLKPLNQSRGVNIDKEGNILVAGVFGGTGDFDPGPAVHSLICPNPLESGFVAKYDSSGKYKWAFAYGFYPGASIVKSVTSDPAGNVYIVGTVADSADLDPGSGVAYLKSGQFIAKYNSLGEFIWAYNTLPNQNYSMGYTSTSIFSDGHSGIYVAGTAQDSADFALGTDTLIYYSLSNRIIAKYDTSGVLLWVKDIGGGTPACCGIVSVDPKIFLDDSLNVYVAGQIYDVEDFDPGAGVNNIGVGSSYAGFIIKYDSSGNYLKAFQSGIQAKAVSVTPDFSLYTAGEFAAPFFDFAPGPETFIVYSGYVDTYVAKYGNNLTNSIGELPIGDVALRIFPNPANDQLFIETSNNIAAELNIYEVGGSLLIHSNLPKNESIDVSQLAKGVYVAEIKTRESSVRIRWIKI